jgi:MFS transporter, Spinster family, sphingosine-1-phosphate transporter
VFNVAAPRQALWLLAFMWGAYFLNYCDRQAIFSMFPVLRSDLGLTDTQLGLTGSIFLWVYGIGCPIAGQLGDRFSKRLLVVLSLVIWSVVVVITGFAASAVSLLTLRGAMGIAECLFMPAAIALTAGAFPPAGRSRAIAALTTAQIAGVVGGGWFGGWMAQHGRWREAFFLLGAVGVLYAAPYFLFLRGAKEGAQEEKTQGAGGLAVAELFRTPIFLLLCAVFSIFVFGLWLLYSWLPDFLHEKFALNLTDAAFNATAYLQGATFVGILAGGFLADWLFQFSKAARLWLLVASLAFCAPCLHAIGGGGSLVATRLAAAGFGLSAGLLMGNIFPASFEIVSLNARASAVGLLNFFGAAVSGCATLFGGIWKKTVGMERLLTGTALAYFAAALLLILGVHLLFPATMKGSTE